MRPLLYIETTIPSHYCDERPSLAAEIRRTQLRPSEDQT